MRKGSQRTFGKDVMKGSSPRVPQQDNFSDCGIYVLQYVESFFEVNVNPAARRSCNASDRAGGLHRFHAASELGRREPKFLARPNRRPAYAFECKSAVAKSHPLPLCRSSFHSLEHLN